MTPINHPDVVAVVTALHDAYETALADNDVDALNRFFWHSPHVVRFGMSEHLYGADAIATYRQGVRPTAADRRIIRRVVSAFGPDAASVMCEITQIAGGMPQHVRQSQFWIRWNQEGWKIVAAHVSAIQGEVSDASRWKDYAARTSAAIGLPLTAYELPSVASHLERAAQIAGPLLAYAVPDSVERAAIFQP